MTKWRNALNYQSSETKRQQNFITNIAWDMKLPRHVITFLEKNDQLIIIYN